MIPTQEAVAHQGICRDLHYGLGKLQLEDFCYDRGDKLFFGIKDEGCAQEKHGPHDGLRLRNGMLQALAHLRETEQDTARSEVVKIWTCRLADLARQGHKFCAREIAAGHCGEALQECR